MSSSSASIQCVSAHYFPLLSLSAGLFHSPAPWLSLSLPLFLSQLLFSLCLLCKPLFCVTWRSFLAQDVCDRKCSAHSGQQGHAEGLKAWTCSIISQGGCVPPTLHASGACSPLICVRPEGQNRIFPGVMSSSLLLTIKTLFGFAESTLFPLPHWPAFSLFISSLFFTFHSSARFWQILEGLKMMNPSDGKDERGELLFCLWGGGNPISGTECSLRLPSRTQWQDVSCQRAFSAAHPLPNETA